MNDKVAPTALHIPLYLVETVFCTVAAQSSGTSLRVFVVDRPPLLPSTGFDGRGGGCRDWVVKQIETGLVIEP